jgi:hypothetical protein
LTSIYSSDYPQTHGSGEYQYAVCKFCVVLRGVRLLLVGGRDIRSTCIYVGFDVEREAGRVHIYSKLAELTRRGRLFDMSYDVDSREVSTSEFNET